MLTITDLLKIKPVMFDGAMGTAIQSLNLEDADPPENLILHNPEALELIHKNYIEAGSKVIETNTFGGSRARLELAGLADRTIEINEKAVAIAKKAADGTAYVAGSIGPSGFIIEPFGDVPRKTALGYFEEQAKALIGAGVDLILIETMISLDEALIALDAAKRAGSKLTGVTLTFDIGAQGVRTSFGESPIDAANRLKGSGADFIGSNCGHGFTDMLTIAAELKAVSKLPILVQPNAGLPKYEDGKIFYEETPEKFGEFVKKIASLNVEFIGGCCGTTYEHIAAAKKAISKK